MSAAQDIGRPVAVESPHCEIVCTSDDREHWLAATIALVAEAIEGRRGPVAVRRQLELGERAKSA